jgi:hypothetical protein
MVMASVTKKATQVDFIFPGPIIGYTEGFPLTRQQFIAGIV